MKITENPEKRGISAISLSTIVNNLGSKSVNMDS